MKIVKKILSAITRVEYAIMIVSFIIMVACYFISVVNRNFIKGSVPWTEELAMYSMVYLALLGTEVGLRDGTQVAVTAVIDKLHGVSRKVVDIIKQICLEIFAFVMVKAGFALFKTQLLRGQKTPVLKIPMAYMYFSLALAFGIIFIVQLVILIEMFVNFSKKGDELQ